MTARIDGVHGTSSELRSSRRSHAGADSPVHAVVCGDLNLLRCFAGTGIPALVVTSDARDVTLRSRHCRQSAVIAPPSEPERAVADLVAIGRSLGNRAVLYYGTDALLLLISRHRS